MEALLLNSVLVVGGIYFLIRNVHLLRSEAALRDYMQNSPKAVFWVSKYGLEEAMRMARTTFIPLGTLLSAAMVGFGSWNLWRIYA